MAKVLEGKDIISSPREGKLTQEGGGLVEYQDRI